MEDHGEDGKLTKRSFRSGYICEKNLVSVSGNERMRCVREGRRCVPRANLVSGTDVCE